MERCMQLHKRILHNLECSVLSGRLIPGCHISFIRVLAQEKLAEEAALQEYVDNAAILTVKLATLK